MKDTAPIPLAGPDVGDAEVEAVTAVLRSGRLSLGPRLPEFEAAFAAAVGTRHAVAVNSGTSALHLALFALGIGPGDEVVTTSFSFVASTTCILFVGATPVFADVDATTLNLDPDQVEAAITPRTRAILVVHVFGRPAPMDRITEIARRHGLRVIEDACEALGAECGGRRAGALGDVSAFGFYPNKIVTTGEGGMLATDDDEVAGRARRLRNQGRDPASPWLEHVELGYNYRLSEMACALGTVQLSRLVEKLRRREALARSYHRALAGTPGLRVPEPEAPGGRIAWFAYVVRVPGARDRVQAGLAERGIATGRYFPPIHRQPLFRGRRVPSLPVTEAAGEAVLALPFFERLTEEQQDRVVEGIRELLG